MQVPNNYETDLIYPIIARAAELANVNYQTADDQVKTYLKVCTPFLFGLLAQV
jgi:alanyl-tRNA synthetase